jgi:hypothetical protein
MVTALKARNIRAAENWLAIDNSYDSYIYLAPSALSI